MAVRARLRRTRDLMLAVAAGTGMTLVVYAMLTRPLPDTISRYFVENAYAEGGGRNVVNVILVDFRGFDTFGEIIVLAVVAHHGLLRSCAGSGRRRKASRHRSSSGCRMPMTRLDRTARSATRSPTISRSRR